jgi:hypothetical protein
MVKFHPKKIIGAKNRNTTTLGFHGITMGTHTKYGRGYKAWVAWGGGVVVW